MAAVNKKFRLKKGDLVQVIAGKDKGKQGEIVRVVKENDRVVVAGANVAKRHEKPGPASQGGIVDKELSLHISNVALVDPKENKPTRVGYKVDKDGNKTRIAKRSGEAA